VIIEWHKIDPIDPTTLPPPDILLWVYIEGDVQPAIAQYRVTGLQINTSNGDWYLQDEVSHWAILEVPDPPTE
jgi:hypothetical protein